MSGAGDVERLIARLEQDERLVSKWEILKTLRAAHEREQEQEQAWKEKDAELARAYAGWDSERAEVAALRTQLQQAREHVADCFHCQQRGACDELEALLSPKGGQ